GDDRLDGEWRRTIVLAAIFPGFVIQLQPDWLWFLMITPMGTDQVRIAWQVAVAPTTLAAADDPDARIADINALIDQVNREDHPVVAGIRRSVDRPQFDRAPLSYLERNVFDFDRYLTTRLSR
ncbi:MAG: SRPBCC family protein, partial [Ilumatobacteraceae bacterium]